MSTYKVGDRIRAKVVLHSTSPDYSDLPEGATGTVVETSLLVAVICPPGVLCVELDDYKGDDRYATVMPEEVEPLDDEGGTP